MFKVDGWWIVPFPWINLIFKEWGNLCEVCIANGCIFWIPSWLRKNSNKFNICIAIFCKYHSLPAKHFYLTPWKESQCQSKIVRNILWDDRCKLSSHCILSLKSWITLKSTCIIQSPLKYRNKSTGTILVYLFINFNKMHWVFFYTLNIHNAFYHIIIWSTFNRK